MNNIAKIVLALAIAASSACSTIERGNDLRAKDPAAYEAMDQNAHYHSDDRKDWVEGA